MFLWLLASLTVINRASTLHLLLHQFIMASPVQVYQFVKGCVGFSRFTSLDRTTMDEKSFVASATQISVRFSTFLRKCLFSVLSVGPIPTHIAFIMDGNRRYARQRGLPVGEGHKAGYWALLNLLRYCWEMGVKYVTVYAFSIDNFKRSPQEVEILMDLLKEKIDGLLDKESYLNQAGVRVCFVGNLKLLSEPVRVAAENAMKATANNTKAVLSICVAYTSTDEIVHAAEESCLEKLDEVQVPNGRKVNNGASNFDEEGKKVKRKNGTGDLHEDASNDFDEEVKMKLHVKVPQVKLVDVEKHMYMSVAPDPDIMIRTSGETRLSNFLLWQTSTCPLEAPAALWPELGLWHLVWAVLNYQRDHHYLEKKKKQV